MSDLTQAAPAAVTCKFCRAANEGVGLDAEAFRCGNCGAENLTAAGKARRGAFATEGDPDVVQGKTTFGGTVPDTAPAPGPETPADETQPAPPATNQEAPAGGEEPQVS